MTPDERRAWGPVVRAARDALGLTQEEVATRAGISRPTLRGIENGTTDPQEDKLRAVLAALYLVDDLANPDVTVFLARLRPLMARLDKDTRDRLMPAVVSMVSRALEVSDVVSDELAQRRSRRVPSDLPDTITDEDLIGQPSVAMPEPRNDVEGDTDPEEV